MSTEAHATLRMYVNDMLAAEKEIHSAISGHVSDERVQSLPAVHNLLSEIALDCDQRHRNLESLSSRLEGKAGAAIKEAVMIAVGTLAGLYGMVRKHPISRMLRDDQVALNLLATSYGMLYTTALIYEDDETADIALEHLNQIPSQIMRLTRLTPGVIVKELAEGAPNSLEVESLANEAIEAAWTDAEVEVAHPL